MKRRSETWLRSIITAVALVNSICLILGKTPLPWSNNEIYEGLSAVLAVITTAWSWWKNNSFTTAAIKADEYMKGLKDEDYRENL